MVGHPPSFHHSQTPLTTIQEVVSGTSQLPLCSLYNLRFLFLFVIVISTTDSSLLGEYDERGEAVSEEFLNRSQGWLLMRPSQ